MRTDLILETVRDCCVIVLFQAHRALVEGGPRACARVCNTEIRPGRCNGRVYAAYTPNPQLAAESRTGAGEERGNRSFRTFQRGEVRGVVARDLGKTGPLSQGAQARRKALRIRYI